LLPPSLPRPTRSSPFPYSTLFRSIGTHLQADLRHAVQAAVGRSAHAQQPATRGTAVSPKRLVRPAVAAHSSGAFPVRRCLGDLRSEEHTSELQSRENLVCRLLLEK